MKSHLRLRSELIDATYTYRLAISKVSDETMCDPQESPGFEPKVNDLLDLIDTHMMDLVDLYAEEGGKECWQESIDE